MKKDEECVNVCSETTRSIFNLTQKSNDSDYQVRISSDIQCQNIAKKIIEKDLEGRSYMSEYPKEYYEDIDNLRFDSQKHICYSNKTIRLQSRWLQKEGQTCEELAQDCFNCSALSILVDYGYGDCKWVDGVCSSDTSKFTDTIEDPYFNFQTCGDPQYQCKTNLQKNMQQLAQSTTYYFTIDIDDNSEIQSNQACIWEFTLQQDINYQLEFEREWVSIPNYGYYLLEEINVYMHTSSQTYYLADKYIRPESTTSIVFNVYSGTEKVQIFARNYYTVEANSSTFNIKISGYTETEAKSNIFSIIALVLFILMAVFICVCMICIIRICMNRRNYQRNIQNQIDRRENTVRAQREQENRLLDLISVIREKHYDKRMDKYKQYECVICLEEFVKNSLVKKIPICKHLFHSRCLDQLLKSKVVEEVYKCPLCNCEITMEKIREAKKQDREKRKARKGNVIIPIMEQIDKSTNPDQMTQIENQQQTEVNGNRQSRLANFEQSQVTYQNPSRSPQRRTRQTDRSSRQLNESSSPLTQNAEVERSRQEIPDQLVDL